MKIGKALFTKAGAELINICGATRNQEFYEYAVEQLGKQGITLSTILPNVRLNSDPAQTARGSG